MFTIDQKITDLKIRDKNLLKVFFSMNNHQVAAPDMSLQEARSYVFFLREGRDRISVYIGLHFLDADRKLFYTHTDNPFPDSKSPDIEDESRHFAEDLGAMLDEIDFSKMSDTEKDRWIDEQEIFTGRKKSPDAPEPSAAASAPAAPAQPELKPNQAEQNAPAVQPMPVQQPTAPPAPPAAQTAVVAGPSVASAAAVQQRAPVAEPQPVQTAQPQAAPTPPPQPVTPVQPGPAAEIAVQQPQRAQTRRSPAAPAPQSNGAISATETEQTAPLQPANDVLEKAVKAGIVKAPRAQLRKDIRSANGVVSRDKEALARLLSSF